MNTLFVGIYGLGALALDALLRGGCRIAGVVTKPDRGPGQAPLFSLIERERLPVFMPESPREASFLDRVEALKPDLIAVAGYHLRIPLRLLRLPPLGTVNTHLSLLPRYRGPCPWKWAIIRGERETGVTIHRMSARFDEGPLLSQRRCAISDEDTGESLFQRLSLLGAGALADVVQKIQDGAIEEQVQDAAAATYDGAPSEQDARIPWANEARVIRDLIRGLHPRPGAWTTWEGERIRIRRASLGGNAPPGVAAGTIVGAQGGTVQVVAGEGLLNVQEWHVDTPEPRSPTIEQFLCHQFV